MIIIIILTRIDNGWSSYRLNFNPDKKNKIQYNNYKEHRKMSKTAKFGCEML